MLTAGVDSAAAQTKEELQTQLVSLKQQRSTFKAASHAALQAAKTEIQAADELLGKLNEVLFGTKDPTKKSESDYKARIKINKNGPYSSFLIRCIVLQDREKLEKLHTELQATHADSKYAPILQQIKVLAEYVFRAHAGASDDNLSEAREQTYRAYNTAMNIGLALKANAERVVNSPQSQDAIEQLDQQISALEKQLDSSPAPAAPVPGAVLTDEQITAAVRKLGVKDHFKIQSKDDKEVRIFTIPGGGADGEGKVFSVAKLKEALDSKEPRTLPAPISNPSIDALLQEIATLKKQLKDMNTVTPSPPPAVPDSQQMIEKLTKEIADLKSQIAERKARRPVAPIPMPPAADPRIERLMREIDGLRRSLAAEPSGPDSILGVIPDGLPHVDPFTGGKNGKGGRRVNQFPNGL